MTNEEIIEEVQSRLANAAVNLWDDDRASAKSSLTAEEMEEIIFDLAYAVIQIQKLPGGKAARVAATMRALSIARESADSGKPD